MARFEIRRYVYMCDGYSHQSTRCKSADVIDAVNERDADMLARKRGWEVGRNGKWTCRQEHWHNTRKAS